MTDKLLRHGYVLPEVQVTSRGERSRVDTLSKGFVFRYMLATLGLFTGLMTPVTMSLAIRVSELVPADKNATLGWILGLGALFATLANPIAGMLSDRLRSRFGRRRPLLIGGVLGAVACSLVIGTSTSISVITMAWCLTQLFSNASIAALVAIVPDRVPVSQRAQISAFYGMSANVAVFVGSTIVALTGAQGPEMIVYPCLLALFTMLVFIAFYDDEPTNQAPKRPLSLVTVGSAFWLNPIRHPDFAWAWFSRFMVYLGTATLMTYQVYYLRDGLGYEPAEISGKMLFSTLAMTLTVIAASWGCGRLSDCMQRRKPFIVISGVVYAFGVLLIPLIGGFNGLMAGIIVSSIGLGGYLAVDQALVVDILPGSQTDAAKNLGIINIANAVPQTAAPIFGPLFLAINSVEQQNYDALFMAAAIFAIVGSFAVLFVRGAR